jgi:hypothetical protein
LHLSRLTLDKILQGSQCGKNSQVAAPLEDIDGKPNGRGKNQHTEGGNQLHRVEPGGVGENGLRGFERGVPKPGCFAIPAIPASSSMTM